MDSYANPIIQGFNKIPIHSELISVLKKIDIKEANYREKIVNILKQICSGIEFEEGLISNEQKSYVENIILFHKLFSQIDVDYKVLNKEPCNYNALAIQVIDALKKE